MKPILKRTITIAVIILIIASLVFLGIHFKKINLEKWKPKPLVEQIPYEEELEVLEYEDAEFYDSTNEFMRAEIKIKVRFPSRFEPADRLPSEYKRGQKKAYTTAEINVIDIPSLEMLGKMKQALVQRKYLKLAKNKEIQVNLKESQIDGKKVKAIEKIFLKPESYYFVQY